MPNPFRYGGIVTGDYFANRKKELKQLIEDLSSGQNILIYSPRKYGKTSLMIMTLDTLEKKGVIPCLIDLYGCVSRSDLVDKMMKEIVVPSYSTIRSITNFLKSAFSGFRPQITLNPDGSVDVSFKREVQAIGEEKVLSEVLDAAEKLAEAKKKRVVVVLDEFQEISNLNGTEIEKLMRSHFQHHRNVTYVFMGSKRHLIEQIFGEEHRAFYRFAKVFPLGKIPKKDFFDFVLQKFKKTGVDIDDSIVSSILSFTDGHPYFTQQLCHELWNISHEKGRVHDKDIEEAIESILRMHSDFFIRIWDSLSTTQKKLLVGLSYEKKVQSVYSISFIEKYNLISSSHVQKSLEQLLKEGLIEKTDETYDMTDIFFKEWIKNKIGKI